MTFRSFISSLCLALLLASVPERSQAMPGDDLFSEPDLSSASDLPSEEDGRLHAKAGVGYGRESNVFYSEKDPLADSFTLTEIAVDGVWKPAPKSHLFVDLWGNFQRFHKHSDADRVMTDLLISYQHDATSSMGFGLSNTLTYADLELFDTQGNTLPRDKFGSLSERFRVYSFFYPSPSFDIEMGGSYRGMNVEETEDFESLDFKILAADLSSRYFFGASSHSRLRYEYSVVSYDELQALNRNTSFDGLADPGNPTLQLIRHDFSLKLRHVSEPRLELVLMGRLRLNRDTFQDDLTYRENEVTISVTRNGGRFVGLYLELSRLNRDYSHRRKELGSDETLNEAFWVGNVDLSRDVMEWLELYLRYQWIRGNSNAPSGQFDDRLAMLGLRLKVR